MSLNKITKNEKNSDYALFIDHNRCLKYYRNPNRLKRYTNTRHKKE